MKEGQHFESKLTKVLPVLAIMNESSIFPAKSLLKPFTLKTAQGEYCPSFGLLTESNVLLQCARSSELSLSDFSPQDPGLCGGTSSLNLP